MYAGLVFIFNLYSASSSNMNNKPKELLQPSSVFSVNFKNEAKQSIKIFTHNAEPLANVGGQEIARTLVVAGQKKIIEMDSPFFAVFTNQGAYYILLKLEEQVVLAAKNKVPTIILHPLASRMAMNIEGVSFGNEQKECELLKMVDLLDAPACFDGVEDDLLEKCGIRRSVKDSPSFYRRYLRKSVE